MRYNPLIKGADFMLHGADYNPEQWKDSPKIIDEDMRLMRIAGMNSMSVGIFSWAEIEPHEGVYEFGFMDSIIEKLENNGIKIILATPSAARPAWLAQKYPEVLRVSADRRRILFSGRHNHCYTSPVYRDKVMNINRAIAERYKNSQAIGLWHISNEFNGECHCELCQERFREWLKIKFNNDLDKLNREYWTAFWSHTYTDWSQIESYAPHGENLIHGLMLDWKRFVTDMTIDFIECERTPLRMITPEIPVTTNLMGHFEALDYFKLSKHLDLVSWDSYPVWKGLDSDMEMAAFTAFWHDMIRSLKSGKPFLLMESTPSVTNWFPRATLKRPNQHMMTSMQAVAHGSDSVQYFQWRKSRGCSEKFHGAVVDHVGHENTRVFKDVVAVGDMLKKLEPVRGCTVESKVAILFDWDNWWALNCKQGIRNDKKDYLETVFAHYRALWGMSISVDFLPVDGDYSIYNVVIAPMLYMIKPGIGDALEKYVENGGTLITTYLCGIVNENDLCYLGGTPAGLRNFLGVWAEEIDVMPDDTTVTVNMGKEYKANVYCELSHLETAEALAVYDSEFYAGMPAVTLNRFGKGKAYYIAFKSDNEFYSDFYGKILAEHGISNPLNKDVPESIDVRMRTDGETDYIFLFNTLPYASFMMLDKELEMLEGGTVGGRIDFEPYGTYILKRMRA